MGLTFNYELKLASRKVVVWDGATPEDAIRSYQECRPGDRVIAWRLDRRPAVIPIERVDRIRIIEPEPGMARW